MGFDKLKALIFAADGFEDQELFYPLHRLKEESIDVRVASMRKGTIVGKHGYSIDVNVRFEEIKHAEYDILVIAGGKAPEKVRLNEKALKITRHFFDKEKPVAAICHGAQVLISANVLEGRRATCYIGIRDDLKMAGAIYEDREVVVDGNLITSRHPFDLYAFGREIVKIVKKT